MNYIDLKNDIDRYIKNNLTSKRYNHSIEVAKMAKKLAKENCLNENKAYIAGLAHDIAREVDRDELRTQIEAFKEFSDEFYLKPMIFHGPVGIKILEEQFLINDLDILEAVKYHSIGNLGIGKLAKVVYVADYISMDRVHITECFRTNLLKESLDKMVLIVVQECRTYLNSIGNYLLPETENMYNDIIRNISEKEK